MSTECKLVETPSDREQKVCSVCGFTMRSKLPVEKCHAICGVNKATGNIVVDVNAPPQLVWPHIGFGDLLELTLRCASLGVRSKQRQKLWIATRNFLFVNRLFRDVLGVYVRPSKSCDCESRRVRWNTYGALIVPPWMRRVFGRWIKPQVVERSTRAAIAASPRQSCPTCATSQKDTTNEGSNALAIVSGPVAGQ